MYCTTCGKELPDGSSVCDECKTRFTPEGRPISSGNETDSENHNENEPGSHRPYMDYTPFSSAYEPESSGQEPPSQREASTYSQNSYGRNPYWKKPYEEDNSFHSGQTGFAIASLILGIIAVCSCCLPIITIPLGILAVIFGVLGTNSINRGIAIAGLVLGIIALVFGVLMLIILLLSTGSSHHPLFWEFY